MDIRLMKEKYEDLLRRFDESGPDDCGVVAREALGMLRELVYPDYKKGEGDE